MIPAYLFRLIFYHLPVPRPRKTIWYFEVMAHTLLVSAEPCSSQATECFLLQGVFQELSEQAGSLYPVILLHFSYFCFMVFLVSFIIFSIKL